MLQKEMPPARGISEAQHTENTRNQRWSRDELILAFALYMTNPSSPPGKDSKEVRELSALLRLVGKQLGVPRGTNYRNSNGVYMKMMNFRRFDPAFIGSGKVGLSRGNKDEEVVWRDFAHDNAKLGKVAFAIRAAVELPPNEQPPVTDDDEMAEAPEGRLLSRLHRFRERNRKLVERRKAKTLQRVGHLSCEVCEFDFQQRYGDRGKGFIEAHHTKPIETLTDGSKTKLEDLALVCSNCHRMIHATRPWLTIDELKAVLIVMP